MPKKIKPRAKRVEEEVKVESPKGFEPTGRFEVITVKGGYQVLSPIGAVIANHANPDESLEGNYKNAKHLQGELNRYVIESVHPDVWKASCEKAKDQGLL